MGSVAVEDEEDGGEREVPDGSWAGAVEAIMLRWIVFDVCRMIQSIREDRKGWEGLSSGSKSVES